MSAIVKGIVVAAVAGGKALLGAGAAKAAVAGTAKAATGLTTGKAILGASALNAGASLISGSKAASAAEDAAAIQAASQGQAIDEQRRQFDAIQELLKPYTQAGKPDLTQPYVQAGPGALQAMQGLAGLRGAGEQQAAINQIQQSAQFQEMARQGEQGILQNAAATGGLRGGNVQAALAQFRPALLSQLIESQYGKLAGLTSLGSTSAENLLRLGQASAAGTAAAGQQSAQNIGNLMVGQGQAQAAGQIGAANAFTQGLSGVTGAIGGGVQNYMLMQQLNKPSYSSGIGTGGFAGSYQEAQQMYGGAPVAYFAPQGPGAPGGWYPQS
jgi:hypothetical protein